MKNHILLGAMLIGSTACAQTPSAPAAAPPFGAGSVGSGNFCLFALPADDGAQRWINLGIVQFVEIRADSVLITYGGGNLGSGHEAKIPVNSREEASAILNRLRQTAEDCARRSRGEKQ
jgi:hypothetical protein